MQLQCVPLKRNILGKKIVYMEKKNVHMENKLYIWKKNSDIYVTRCSCNVYLLRGICGGKKLYAWEKKMYICKINCIYGKKNFL